MAAEKLRRGPRPDPEARAQRASARLAAGRAYRERRKAAGVSQAEVAAALGLSRGIVGEWERGKASLPPDADAGISLAQQAKRERTAESGGETELGQK